MNPLKYDKSVTKLQELLSVSLDKNSCQFELSKCITLFYEMHTYNTACIYMSVHVHGQIISVIVLFYK